VEPDGQVRYLDAAEVRLERTASWRSAETKAEYPSGWRLRLASAGLDLEIRPVVLDQENVARRARLHYWEGLADVFDESGLRVGNGYVELTGYGHDNRPPL
jgi:predicted secreted hydrolase